MYFVRENSRNWRNSALAVKHRRPRRVDPLASPEAIRGVLCELRKRLPLAVPASESQTIKLLNAVRNIERHASKGTRRGRPSRWKRQDLLNVASQLRAILSRETKGRVSLNSFTGVYVRLLGFPRDVLRALETGDITLFEAAQLARLTEERLGSSAAEARRQRKEFLKTHSMTQGSQARLKARIDDRLGINLALGPQVPTDSAIELVDNLIEVDPYDSRHLFWEELRRISASLRNVRLEDVNERTLKELLPITERLSQTLDRIQKRRENYKPRILKV
jgi:hypothetical protein